MIKHIHLAKAELIRFLRNKDICLAGNSKLKIFGTLTCKSGKRMLRENRVFFKSETEALDEGFRPCGHCLNYKYKEWIYLKQKQI